MITRFNNYIVESSKSIDELETLTPEKLGKLLLAEVHRDHPDIRYIQDLIAVGCPIDYKSDYGWTPLHYAAMDGDLIVVKFLLSKGADIHTRDDAGWTALHWAACKGHLEIIKYLVSVGGDIHAENKWDRTAWDIATTGIKQSLPELNPNFVNYIVESRKSVDDLEMLNPFELGELLLAGVKRDSPDVQFIQDLLDVGCTINARDNYGTTALHFAAYYGHLEIVKLLVSNGAEINARNDTSRTPLHLASTNGHFEVVKFLIYNGAEIDARNDLYWTSLHEAVNCGHIKVVKLLISKGADIEARDGMKLTALHMASRHGNCDIVKYLISKGAQVDVQSIMWFTPWDYASAELKACAPELNPKK